MIFLFKTDKFLIETDVCRYSRLTESFFSIRNIRKYVFIKYTSADIRVYNCLHAQ